MKEKIILMIAGMLVERLDPELLKKWADMGLDLLENQIAKSETTMDDKLALPVIAAFREAFNIPDND
jgi:hypothetical protein